MFGPLSSSNAGFFAVEFFLDDDPLPGVAELLLPHDAFDRVERHGLVGADGIVEFKALDGAQHCEFMQTGEIDAGYLAQMQFGLACAERSWCDFGSYCPTMKEEHKLWVRRVYRDDLIIRQMESAVIEFLAEVEFKVRELLKL